MQDPLPTIVFQFWEPRSALQQTAGHGHVAALYGLEPVHCGGLGLRMAGLGHGAVDHGLNRFQSHVLQVYEILLAGVA